MTAYVALLRAINVGGTGKLSMSELKALAEDAGFTRARTYIASGNLVFESPAGETAVKAALDARVAAALGKPAGVIVRTAAEMAAVLAANPFTDAAPERTVAIFLDRAPPADALDHAVAPDGEQLALGAREIYVHYPNGMGRSKLKLPSARDGTARNLNSIARLAEMAASPR